MFDGLFWTIFIRYIKYILVKTTSILALLEFDELDESGKFQIKSIFFLGSEMGGELSHSCIEILSSFCESVEKYFFASIMQQKGQPRSQGLSFCHLGETLDAAGHVPPRFWVVNLIVTVRGVGKERVCSVLKLQLWVMKFTVNLQQRNRKENS